MEEIINRSESSVNLIRNSRGVVQIDVKAYGNGEGIEEAMEKAKKVFDQLNSKYPKE